MGLWVILKVTKGCRSTWNCMVEVVCCWAMTSSSSFKQFSLENDMQDVTQDNAAMDSIYNHDSEEQKKILAAKPWSSKYILLPNFIESILIIQSPPLQKDPYFCCRTHQNGIPWGGLTADGRSCTRDPVEISRLWVWCRAKSQEIRFHIVGAKWRT